MSTKKKSGNGKVEILIAEDSPTQAEQLKQLIEKHGYHVLSASNGKEALTFLHQHKPLIIISDIIMPEMDGYELCRQVKANEKFKSIPVILLTALSNSEDVIKGLECGADNFITKPYDENYLISRINYLLTNMHLQDIDESQMGLTIHFGKQKYFISSNRRQIFNLLLSTYETAIQKNRELERVQEELRRLNEQLEERVKERTTELIAEVEERKRFGEALRVSHHSLEISNRHSEMASLLKEFVSEIKNFSGCAAVGIRLLDKEGNIPYQAYEGFSQTFYESESPLSIKSDQCMCINVIKRMTNSKLSFYTKGGSFYTNGSTRLLATVSEEERGKTRNVCNQFGYESVVLVPIRIGDRILGLIHTADPRENKAPLEMVEVLESIGIQLGTAIQRLHDAEGIKRSEAKYRTLFEQSMDAVYITTREGRFVDVNQSMLDLFGYTREEMMRMYVRKIYANPPDRHKFQQEIEQKGFVKDYDIKFRKKDGTEIDCLVSAVLRLANDGSILGYQGIIHDITKRKRMEEELRLRAELLDNVTDSIFVHDIEGNFIYVNERAYKSRGYTKDELMGMNVRELDTPEYASLIEPRITNLMEKGELTFESAGFCKDKSIIPLEIHSRIIDSDGQKLILNVGRDVTERKKAEQQLLMTSKLASVGELAAGVAHEINNPLTGVIGFAQLLMEAENVPPEIKEDLQKICEESQRAVRIVQNLLRFARRHKPEKDYVDISDLIEHTLEMESYRLRTSNIALTTNLATDLPLITADHNQLQQVILNIMTNAEQAVARTKRKGKITVTTEKSEDYVRISISDNGPGIEPEHITKIFDPFFTTKEVGSGTGLGLSICHGIIAEHGGRIYAESAPGKGATFIIALPVAVEKEKKAAKAKSHRPRQKATGNILIVEDEPSIRAVLTRTISASGYQAQAVSDGKAALRKLAENVYDLLIVDLKMSGLSGRELYEIMKKSHPNMAKRVVFITGDVVTADTHDFLVSTGKPYLSKPFNPREIIDVIEKALGGM